MLRIMRIAAGSLCLWASIAMAGLPETPQPLQITVADGLPSNHINGIAEDASGYLWIATADGLVRYDGISYRVWRVGQGLRDNFVWAVHVDAGNRIWIGTSSKGLAMLDVDRSTFHYFDKAHDPRIGSDDVWSIVSTPDGALWFGTSDGGLHRMDKDGGITRFMPRKGDDTSLPDSAVGQLVIAPDGALWVGTKSGVARWTGHGFARLPDSAINAPTINGLRFDPDGTLWIGTPMGVSEVRPDGSVSLQPWPDYPKTVFQMLLRDAAGNRWLDTSDGMGRDSGGKVVNVPLYSNSAHGTVRPSWTNGYEDREGGLWFASNSGLWYLEADWARFSVLSRTANDPGSPGNAYVRGIAPSASASMWLAGTGGILDLLDPESGQIEHRVQDIGAGYVPMSVHEDRHGQVWVSYYAGLARYDPSSGALVRWTADAGADAALEGERAWFAETTDGQLWLASEQHGLQVRDAAGHVLDSIRMDGSQGLEGGKPLHQIGIAPDGAIWVAGTQGLLVWNAGAHRFDAVPGAPVGEVAGFALADDTVWLAGFGSLGQYHWDGARLTPIAQFDHRQGLPQLLPSGLTVDRSGLVWMTSMRGLIRFDPGHASARIYGVRDGLPSQEFGDPPVQRPEDGRIVAATPGGLVLFDPAVVHPAETAPELVLESISVRHGNQRIVLPSSGEIVIANEDRDLRIIARLLSFDNAKSHRFRFLLEPFDAQWVEVDDSGTRTFSHLEPGRYKLRVRAATADNVWSQEQVLALHVQPPWWLTRWALLGFAALAILLVWWVANIYRRRLKQRNAMQLVEHKRELAEHASEAKTRFLANLGHEVRTPMTGVLGMSELLLGTDLDARQRGYTESISRAGKHLLQLVNDALDMARIEAGRLELAAVPFDIRELVDEVVVLMRPLVTQKGLGFSSTLDDEIPSTLLGDRMRVEQILLNLLANAIKFTERGEVALQVNALRPQGVQLQVVDTGPGLNKEQLTRIFERFEQADGAHTAARYGGSGLGLTISQELAAAMGGRISVVSTLGQGACFSVDLPLPAAQARVERTSSALDRAQGLRLLLVEDDQTVAEVIVALLQAQGHQVNHVMHGLAALAETTSARFDAILLDLDLPGMDGIELARQLRAQGLALPLLAVTARADADAEPQALAAGFDGFVRKPVTGEMLADGLEAALRRAATRSAPA